MNAHIDLYRKVEYIVETSSKELENYSIIELTEFKKQLKNVYKRIKIDRERFDIKKSFYRNSGERMSDLMEKIDEIKIIIKNKEKIKKKINDSPKKPEYEYFIIAELFATNKIEIHEKTRFFYKDIYYEYGAELSKVINNEFGTNNQAFTQYLNDFKSQSGEKYFLEPSNDKKNIRILRKVFEYFSNYQIEVVNEEFTKSFKILKDKNLI
jgi:hypothetical protein